MPQKPSSKDELDCEYRTTFSCLLHLLTTISSLSLVEKQIIVHRFGTICHRSNIYWIEKELKSKKTYNTVVFCTCEKWRVKS